MSEEATVLTDEADGVLVITINRPEAKKRGEFIGRTGYRSGA